MTIDYYGRENYQSDGLKEFIAKNGWNPDTGEFFENIGDNVEYKIIIRPIEKILNNTNKKVN